MQQHTAVVVITKLSGRYLLPTDCRDLSISDFVVAFCDAWQCLFAGWYELVPKLVLRSIYHRRLPFPGTNSYYNYYRRFHHFAVDVSVGFTLVVVGKRSIGIPSRGCAFYYGIIVTT